MGERGVEKIKGKNDKSKAQKECKVWLETAYIAGRRIKSKRNKILAFVSLLLCLACCLLVERGKLRFWKNAAIMV